jgi:hypothetical protein
MLFKTSNLPRASCRPVPCVRAQESVLSPANDYRNGDAVRREPAQSAAVSSGTSSPLSAVSITSLRIALIWTLIEEPARWVASRAVGYALNRGWGRAVARSSEAGDGGEPRAQVQNRRLYFDKRTPAGKERQEMFREIAFDRTLLHVIYPRTSLNDEASLVV